MSSPIVRRFTSATLILGLAAPTGCIKWMRDPEYYGEQLSELIEAREDKFKACYDRYLAEVDETAKGTLVARFVVEADTGRLTEIAVVAEQTTVPEGLAACVTDELSSLKLEPADAKDGHASYTWEFAPGSRKRPPADPFAGAQQAVLACYSSHLSAVDREAQGEIVVDYALSEDSGALERFAIVAEATTAPPEVVDCAKEILAAVKLDPADVDARNLAGRRSFALRYEPYVEPTEPGEPVEPAK